MHFRPALMSLVAVVCLVMPGCGGCRRTDADKAAKLAAEKEKPKPDFEWRPLQLRPAEGNRPQISIKPGHRTDAGLEARANKLDERGELVLDALHGEGVQPIDIDGTPYWLETGRAAIYPKNQRRDLDQLLFCPASATTVKARTRLLTPLGTERFVETTRLTVMPSEQFFFVVLANEPDRYQYLENLDAIRFGAADEDSGFINATHYQVITPDAEPPLALPSSAMQWTATAYVLWDDRRPSDLTIEQQQSLVDWLHWGGQLIVSGPDTLDTLRHSFLDAWLPASAEGAWELDSVALAPLNARPWAVEKYPLRPARPLSGVHLAVRENASTEVTLGDTQPLVVERRVGRGRVVVTAMRLSSRELVEWPGFDRFFHGHLLRQPPRRFRIDPDLELSVAWKDRISNGPPTTRLAVWSRKTTNVEEDPDERSRSFNRSRRFDVPIVADPLVWNDASDVSDAARQALRDAAGIVVPNSKFIAGVVAAYLGVLLVNALFFRLLGRIELAWVAAPLIAIGATAVIVYSAQLDIGFARSMTELDVVELHADYPRAHLTRYVALYSSLGTSYDVAFQEPTSVALPMSAGSELLRLQGRSRVRLQRMASGGENDPDAAFVRLDGFEVASNAAAMLHAEQMADLRGSVSLESLDERRWRVTNGTSLRFAGAGVVLPSGKVAWLGAIAPGERREFGEGDASGWPDDLDQSPLVARVRPAVGLNVRPLIELATKDSDDDFRLVGWTEDSFEGMKVSPTGAQRSGATVVVGHLAPSPLATIEADVNTRIEVKASNK
jgi:hypothetical protein